MICQLSIFEKLKINFGVKKNERMNLKILPYSVTY